jgi:energy-coupling factor transporter ATP-binding protein EcfA2
MTGFQLTVKNYRCFADTDPLRLDVREGFTALTGPNNSGKSSCLKIFYELREVFGRLREAAYLQSLSVGNVIGVNYPGTNDPTEIFYSGNDRPLTIQIDIPDAGPETVSRIVAKVERHDPHNWRGELYAGPDRSLIIRGGVQIDGVDGFLAVDGASIQPPRQALEFLGDLATRAIYVGAFRNAISEGSAYYYDLTIGTTFIDQWDEWKTGDSRRANEAILQLSEELAHIFGYRTLEINSARGAKTLQVVIDGKPYRLREIGAGFAQFLVVLANLIIRQPLYLFIDEPELNLHPSLQADFLTTLASYCPRGVMYATHAIGLARSVSDRIYGFRREGDSTRVRPFEQLSNLAEFVGELSYSSFRDLGSDRILLVEGVTEVKAVQQFLRPLRKDHTSVVLPLGGAQLIRGGVQAELAELRRLSNNVAVLIDSERDSAGAPLTPERRAFVQDCTQLGFRVHVLERRAFENYLSDQAIKAIKGQSYRALQPYERLIDVNPSWGKAENWRIARAMTEAELSGTDLGSFLAQL